MTAARPGRDLERVIGSWSGLAVIVGITIGSGVFRKPYTLARDVGDPPVILALWVGIGLVCLCGALTVAELSSMLPRTGGVYVFLRAAYGDGAAFVFGWLYLLVTTPAAIGALATFFAELVLGLGGLGPGRGPAWLVPAVAASTIVVLSAVNVIGVRPGTAVQSVLTVIKVAALVALMAIAFTARGGTFAHLRPAAGGARNLGSGAASVLWAYDGWIVVSMIAGEVVGAETRMRRILVAGMLAIAALYVGANLGYFYALPVEAMAREAGGVPQRIVADRLGPLGATLIGAAIMCSAFGALNANILAKPRVAYALARDGLSFSWLGKAHARWGTPHAAILVQAAAAVALVALLRDFDRLTIYFIVVELSALVFAVAAVFVLRRRWPAAGRPFRVPAYPWIPLLYVAGTVAGLVAVVHGEIALPVPNYSPVWGLLIAAAGFPVYALWRRLAAITPPPLAPAGPAA